MIQTNELRIGNWIIVQNPFRGEAARATVFNILPDDLMVHDESQHRFAADPSTSEPIPLTPEILEAVGFVRIAGIPNEYFRASYVIRKEKKLDSQIWEVYKHYGEGFNKLRDITHLHQLQNLYFAITGNELEIKF